MSFDRIALPTQYRDAPFLPSTATAEGCIDVCWTTGATVRRYDWMAGREFDEVLSVDPAHVNLSQLNNRAPVLDTHVKDGSLSVKGVVAKAWLEDGKGYATLRYDLKDPDAAEIYRKAKEGFIRGVSVGYDVAHFREVPATDKTRAQLIAEAWTPLEISTCPIGADGDAGVLARSNTRTSSCTLSRVKDIDMLPQFITDLKLNKRDMANMEKIVAALKEYLGSAVLKTDNDKELAAYKVYGIVQAGGAPTAADPAAEDVGAEGGLMMADEKAIAEAARKATGLKDRDGVIEALLSLSIRSERAGVIHKTSTERLTAQRNARLKQAVDDKYMTPAKAEQVKEFFRDGLIRDPDAYLDKELGPTATRVIDTREIEPPEVSAAEPSTPKVLTGDDYLKDSNFIKFAKSRGFDEKMTKDYAASYARLSKGGAFQMPEGLR